MRKVREVDTNEISSNPIQSSSFLSDDLKEEPKELEYDFASIDECENDSWDSLDSLSTEINTVARSQRRTNIKENISSKIQNVMQESNASCVEDDNPDVKEVHAKDARQIKSLVAEKAKPIMVLLIQLSLVTRYDDKAL